MRTRSIVGGLSALIALVACSATPSPRSLEVVEGEVVASEAPDAWQYSLYLRARVAMSADPPRLDEARVHLLTLLSRVPDDPHLWTTLAELEVAAQRPAAAKSALARALALAPDYPDALELQAHLAPEGRAQ